jgi:hypothetical protein
MSASIQTILVSDEYTYAALSDSDVHHTHVLLPILTVVEVRDVQPQQRLLAIPPTALPFGLLEGVSVRAASASSVSLPDFRVHLIKTTGQRVSRRVSAADGHRVSVVQGEMNTDQDAAHDSFGIVQRSSGHNMRFRTIVGDAIVSLAIEFYDVPPSRFEVLYHGVNGVDRSMDVQAVKGAFASKKAVALLLPPITPSKRLSAASAPISEPALTPSLSTTL